MILKEKIENKIKQISSDKKIEFLETMNSIKLLQWVLSELEKMTCQTCKNHDVCERYIRQKITNRQTSQDGECNVYGNGDTMSKYGKGDNGNGQEKGEAGQVQQRA